MNGKIKSYRKINVVRGISALLVSLTILGNLTACGNDSKTPKNSNTIGNGYVTTGQNETTTNNRQMNSKRNNQTSVESQIERTRARELTPYERLQAVRNIKLPTYTGTFKDEDGIRREYEFAREEDVLAVSRELSKAIEEYFESCGASNWTNEDNKQFWPKNIEYIVTAIAFRESTYRTNGVNNIGCAGLTCINEKKLLTTLGEQWLIPRIWGDNVPQVDCDSSTVDILNGTTAVEYTYYNIGYNLANRFKKDKYFTDVDGARRSVWQVLEYSEEMQIRLIIASHLFGVNNVIDSIFGRNYDKNGKLIPINDYIYCGYVGDVMCKTEELICTYEYTDDLTYYSTYGYTDGCTY